MSSKKLTQATVRRGLLEGKTPPDSLAAVDNVCAAGAQCPEVQSSPLAVQALAVLNQTATVARGTMNNKQALAQALMAAAKALLLDLGTVKDALDAYQAAVVIVANGNAKVINEAGLTSRIHKAAPAAVEGVTEVRGVPGKQPGEGVVSWPAVVGAVAYALEVNYTPQNPAGPWTALIPGRGRRRVVTAPAPSAQFLVHVAALGNGNTQSAWSDPILVTAR